MMTLRWRGTLAALVLAVGAPAFAQSQLKFDVNSPITSKEEAHARMRELVNEIDRLRALGAQTREIESLQRHLDAISASLGGDLPARRAPAGATATPVSGSQHLAAPTCGGGALPAVNFAGTTGPILPIPPQPTLFTVNVSGVGTYLWDVDVTTFLTHTAAGDLDIKLISPAGTTVTLTTDNGGTNDDVFNGTVWDDNVNDPTADHLYTNLVTATPLSPEGRLEAFRGENPNGTWTLSVADDTATNTGNLNSWSLSISTLGGVPASTTTNFTRSPGLAITASGTPTITDAMTVSGIGTYLSKLVVYVEVPHTFANDLNFFIKSPAGTEVQMATANGIGEDNVFNGTTFDGSSTLTPTDVTYVDNVVIPLIAPEGAFDNFRGQDPNGVWTFRIFDDANLDGGTLVRWDLNITTIAPPSPSAPANFAGATGAIPDFGLGASTPTTYTAFVSGLGTSLWDVDLTTFITHTAGGDLDMTLTSPAGTIVTISTDNGGANDNVFNGTVWDDNVNDTVADFTYVNNVPVPSLSPEGRLATFRGENPNGVWTLTVTDDAPTADFGDVNAWSLDIVALTSPVTPILTNFTQSPGTVITNVGTPTVTDTMIVSGVEPYLLGLTCYIELPHTWVNDLNITLISPLGTEVKLATNNGNNQDNVFNGTLFDPASTLTPTDVTYVDLVVIPVIAPEGAFDNFMGQDPNGAWTLKIFDDANADGGTLVRWDLNISTCVGAGQSFCSNGSLGIDHASACPCGNTGAPGNGCGHSFDPGGANLDATGSSASDTVQLHSRFEPATSFTLFLQHSLGGDTAFHDGVLCAGGTLIRLRGRAAAGGEAFFPNPAFPVDQTTTLSQRGGTFPGSGATRRYSAWFRNASTTFCPPATANITNGWIITW